MAVPPSPQLSRRAALAGLATALTGTAGCVGTAQQLFEPARGPQVSLEIKTLPTDSDPYGIEIARRLKNALETVGIDAPLTALPPSEFTDQVLTEHDFDIYVGQFPYHRQPDPDTLRALFRSSFGTDRGWQNPFGYINYRADQLLDRQRQAEDRFGAIADLQAVLARTQPATPIVAPEEPTGVRTDRFTNWQETAPTDPYNLLEVTPPADGEQQLRLATTDGRITADRNPIAARFSRDTALTELVYDSLLITTDSGRLEWLAREITWSGGADGEPLTATVTLRDWPGWHDGRFLSAADVAFTYRFLTDTSLGGAQSAQPSPRYHDRAELVSTTNVTDRHELTIEFTTPSRAVAERALTVPILPRHIWRERAEVVDAETGGGLTTTALQTANSSPIGSGPLQFDSATPGQEATFTRFEPHFLWRDTEQITINPEPTTDSTAANRSQNTTTAGSDGQSQTNETIGGMSANTTNQSKTANRSTDGVANVRFPKATVVDEPIEPNAIPNGTGSNTSTTAPPDGSTQAVANGSNVAADNGSSVPVNDSNVSVGNGSNTPVDNGSNVPIDAESIPNGTTPRDDRPVTVDIDPAPLPEGYDDTPPFAGLTVEVAPSDNTVVELLRSGAVDATRGPLGVDVLDRIDTVADGSVMASRSHAVYHLGYNTRSRPLRNPHFRRVIARLIDREAILTSVFDDNGTPATDFLSAGRDESPWLPAELQWDGEYAELPFFGADGSLDVGAAKAAFRELGYTYSTDGELIDPQRSE